MKKRQSLEKIEEKKGRKKSNINNQNPQEKQEHAEDHKTRLERLIPEFYENNKTQSDLSAEDISKDKEDLDTSSDLSDLKEEEKDDLFQRLRTKNKFFNPRNNLMINNNNNYSPEKLNNNLILPIIPNNKLNDNNNSNNTNNNIIINKSNSYNNLNYNSNNSQIYTERKFDENEIKNAAASKFFRVQNKSQSLVDCDPTIINIKKLKNKLEIISQDVNKKKDKVLGIDLFKYDKKKWQKKNLRESERIIMGIKEFEDRRDNIMNRIFSTLDNPKVKEKKTKEDKEDNNYLSKISFFLLFYLFSS